MTAQSFSSTTSRISGEIPALEVRNLSVQIQSKRAQPRSILDDVGFSVMPGEAIGIVGESGSGKSMTSLAVMGLLPSTAEVTQGEVLLGGEDLLRLQAKERRRARGGGISMVLQDPVTALDPSFTIGFQLAESFRLHKGLKGDALRSASIDVLEKVRIPSAAERLEQYPHELSGGMRQRVCSAIALAGDPDVLIADEPTTALDVTTQAQYLTMLRELQETTGFALVLITHDLAIIRQMCDRVVVMYAGQVVESGPLHEVIDEPQHPYTRALFEALPKLDPHAELEPIYGQAPDPSAYPPGCRFAPRCRFAKRACSERMPSLSERSRSGRSARCLGTEDDGWISNLWHAPGRSPTAAGDRDGGQTARPEPRATLTDRPILTVDDLQVHFHVGKGVIRRRDSGRVRAIDGISLTVEEGTTLGVVGESGSGKSTLARVVMRMVAPTSGTVSVDGTDLQRGTKDGLRAARQLVQIVFQDPFSSLDPRMNVGNIVGEPLTLSRNERGSAQIRERVNELLDMVGLPRNSVSKYPHQFSGGQRQRIAIARALAPRPRLLLLDEPTSALDVSVRAQILKLLKDLQAEMGLSYIVISHDLLTVAQMARHVAVMYLGRIVEFGPTEDVFHSPVHPYTQALLSSIPDEGAPSTPRLAPGYEIPSPMRMPTGCRFKNGCMLRRELGYPEQCDLVDPPVQTVLSGQQTACHFPEKAAAVDLLIARD